VSAKSDFIGEAKKRPELFELTDNEVAVFKLTIPEEEYTQLKEKANMGFDFARPAPPDKLDPVLDFPFGNGPGLDFPFGGPKENFLLNQPKEDGEGEEETVLFDPNEGILPDFNEKTNIGGISQFDDSFKTKNGTLIVELNG